MSCGEKYLYIKKQINKKHLFAFVPSRCKSWSCPVCRPIKAKIVRQYIIDNFTSDTNYMMTLTFFRNDSALDTWKKLGYCWNLMRTWLVKKNGKFNYIRIVEPHKNGGYPHLHILVDKFLIDKDMMKMVTQWGFGWNMSNLPVDKKSVAAYMCKYLTKETFNADDDVLRISSKCRIVSVSRGMPAIFSVKSEWECVKYDIPDHHAEYMHSKVINDLIWKGCVYVCSRPFFGGFIIECDIDVDIDWNCGTLEPYVEKCGKNYLFEYMPNGLQMEMDFEDG